MSWLISRALMESYENSRSLPEPVAEYSAATSLDGAPSVPSSGNPTPQAYLPPDRMTAFSRPSRFGMTFSPLTADLGEAVLTWCQAASRARTSQLPAREQASTASDPACGDTWRASLARFDPATSSWRTAQPSLLEDWGESSVTWPRSGMTAGGQCWELPTLGRRISGTGSGLWPTPRAGNPGSRPNGKGGKVLAEEVEIATGLRQRGERVWPTPQTRGFTNDGDLMALAKMCDSWEEMSGMAYRAGQKKKEMYWPTPTASAMPCEGTQRIMRKKWLAGELSLEGASAIAGRDVRKAQGKVPEMWPTPTAHNAKETNAPSESDRNTPTLAAQAGGQLNPTWVELLMGWPAGWTDLKPLGKQDGKTASQESPTE